MSSGIAVVCVHITVIAGRWQQRRTHRKQAVSSRVWTDCLHYLAAISDFWLWDREQVHRAIANNPFADFMSGSGTILCLFESPYQRKALWLFRVRGETNTNRTEDEIALSLSQTPTSAPTFEHRKIAYPASWAVNVRRLGLLSLSREHNNYQPDLLEAAPAQILISEILKVFKVVKNLKLIFNAEIGQKIKESTKSCFRMSPRVR